MSVQFPFPDRENSFPLLEKDPEYGKIPVGQVERVFDRAWNTGVDAANALLASEKAPIDFFALAEARQLNITSKPEDNVAGGVRYYSEFYPKTREIILYNGSVRRWCVANHVSMANGRMLILSHEYFHFLESTSLGWTSKQYEAYMIKIGSRCFGRTGTAALSEIAANAFAYTCFPYLSVNPDEEAEQADEALGAESAGAKKKITFWNRRREELREVYNQFFKF